jgi:hypothetical protein
MTTKHPIDIAGDLKGPVLGLYGGQDQGIPQDSVEQMRKALAETGNTASKASVIHVSMPTRRTPSTPTIGPATARKPPRTAGGACVNGSGRTGFDYPALYWLGVTYVEP